MVMMVVVEGRDLCFLLLFLLPSPFFIRQEIKSNLSYFFIGQLCAFFQSSPISLCLTEFFSMPNMWVFIAISSLGSHFD